MITRFKPSFDNNELKALLHKKNNSIKFFEEEFAKTVGSKYALSFPSARLGLFSLLKSLGITDKKIITPSYTCIVVPSTIIASNNYPSFVDISLFDYNIDLNEISQVIDNETKCIVPTHMYGNPCDIKKIREIVGNEIYIFEDAAQALLTKDVGKYSDACFYSFNFEKQIFTFGGGMVTTNNEEINDKLNNFRKNNFSKNTFSSDFSKSFLLLNTPYIFSDLLFRLILGLWTISGEIGWKKQGWSLKNEDLPVKDIYLIKENIESYSKIQAAVGLSQLKKLNKFIKNRKEIAKYYDKELTGLKNIKISNLIEGSSFSHYSFTVKNRNDFEKFMMKKKIQINKVFDYSTANLPLFSRYVENNKKLNNSQTAGKCNINLPCYPQLLNKKYKLNFIIDSIRKYDSSIN